MDAYVMGLIATPDGGVIAGGGFSTAGGVPVGKIAEWSGRPACAADMTCDKFLVFFDYDLFVTAFELGDPAADFNHDGFQDFFDYDGFVAAFEASC
jgi:hypothetical protein